MARVHSHMNHARGINWGWMANLPGVQLPQADDKRTPEVSDRPGVQLSLRGAGAKQYIHTIASERSISSEDGGISIVSELMITGCLDSICMMSGAQ